MAPDSVLGALAQLYPPERLLTRPAELIPYESDALTAYRARPLAVVLPETQEEVINTVRLCHELGLPFVARGSGTSLSGGSLPVEGGIVIGLNRLNRILRLDPWQRVAVVEPGVINLDVSKAAAPYNLYYAPDPSSQPVCTIGGNVAFNSGGAHCLKYGMTSNHVLGIKAVLADGAVVALGGESLEGSGPDLAGLFVGSEGLFGIALEITLRLLPKVERYRTVLAAYHSLEEAGNAVGQVVASGLLPGAMEIMDNLAIQAAEASVQAGYPLDAAGLLIVELEGEAAQVEVEFEQLLEAIHGSHPYEVRTAQDDAQRLRIWKGRKGAFSAVGRLSPDYVVQDGVVPRGKLGQALAEIERLSVTYGLRVANVFHAGDGNLHPLILYDGQQPGQLERAEEMAGEILQMCVQMEGSITGEHGVGVEKRAYLPVMFTGTDIAAMQRIRRAMDPKELANAGKMFPIDGSPAGPVLDPALAAITHQERAGVRPETVAEVREAVLTYRQLLPRGGGSKPGMSAAMDEHITVLDMQGLSGVLEYEPAEYTFTALAGTPVAEVEALLAGHGQYLPFDPPLGAAGATLGGTLAAGLSGPGRYRFGGVRDFILNVRLVDGLGQLVRGGGKVVKNAAGFDLPKLMVGSAGRLGVMVELTFKVFPCPAAYATLLRDYGDLSQALEAMAKLGTASLDIEAIELEPAQRGARLSVRLAGLADLLAARLDRLRSLLGDGEALQGTVEATYWEGLRQFQWVPADWSLIKVPITPSLVPTLDGSLSSSDLKRRYSVGGNVAWIAQPGRLAGLDNTLIELGLDGVAVLGPARIRVPFLGARRGTEFAARVKQALDPLERFPEL
jgi:glycolate oxidase